MSSLIDHAKTEFSILGWDTTDDEMQQEACKCVMELLETLEKQGHSGFSVLYVLSLFNKLANFKPLSPLTGNADEWAKVTEEDGKPFYQNKRYSYVFKLGEDGQAYDDASYPRRDVTFPYQP